MSASSRTVAGRARRTTSAPGTEPGVTLLGLVERVVAWGAIAGATIYVLINALYVEFYDDFGIRPEDVGWDRLTVLSRAAWIALVGIVAMGLIGYGYAAFQTRGMVMPNGASEQDIQERRSIRRYRMRLRLAAASLAFAILIPAGFFLIEAEVEAEAAEARNGRSGSGISLGVPFIDVRTTRARVTWVGDAAAKPPGLNSAHLIYLGRTKENVALVACGRATLLVPADDVVVELMLHEADLPKDEQFAHFEEVC